MEQKVTEAPAIGVRNWRRTLMPVKGPVVACAVIAGTQFPVAAKSLMAMVEMLRFDVPTPAAIWGVQVGAVVISGGLAGVAFYGLLSGRPARGFLTVAMGLTALVGLAGMGSGFKADFSSAEGAMYTASVLATVAAVLAMTLILLTALHAVDGVKPASLYLMVSVWVGLRGLLEVGDFVQRYVMGEEPTPVKQMMIPILIVVSSGLGHAIIAGAVYLSRGRAAGYGPMLTTGLGFAGAAVVLRFLTQLPGPPIVWDHWLVTGVLYTCLSTLAEVAGLWGAYLLARPWGLGGEVRSDVAAPEAEMHANSEPGESAGVP